MTSTAGQANPTSAPNSSSTAAPSYASAAGATKKPTPTPLTATGAQPPIVVGGPAAASAPASQNGKPVSASPVNGRPNITPAVPAAPAVVAGISNINGASNNHTRKGSVTINAPSSHIANGGPVGGSKANIQFGYNESPAVAHSTPQLPVSAPMPIPGTNSNHHIPSPAQSPSPIPVPTATGGRPPSSAPPGSMTFGSFPGEGDRHLRNPPAQNHLAMGHQQAGTHNRRDSQVSAHGDMSSHGPNRGGYQASGGRGGRNFTAPYNQPTMGYPPNNHNGQRYGGPNAGRGGMQYQPNRNSMGPFPNSPQPPRASPAPVHAVPHPGTPNMQQAVPMAPQAANFYPPNFYQQQQMGPMYPQQFDPYGRPYPVPGYPQPYGGQPAYMNQQPPASGPGFGQQFNPYQQGPPAAQPMSRNSSQVSERPSSSTGHSQAPLIAQTPTQRSSQPTPPAVVQGMTRPAPKQSKKIVIKTPGGKILDFEKIKAPASPAAASHVSTPPVVASTPTPPPKPSTPLHTRTDSASVTGGKTAEQIKSEFAERVRKTAAEGSEGVVENKAKPDEAAAAEEKAKKEEEQRTKEAERIAAEKKAEDDAKAQQQAEAEAKAKAESDAKAKADADAESKAKAEAESQAASAKEEEPKGENAAETEDEALERMIREMEEADARREKEQEELTRKKKAAAEEAKKRADADKEKLAAENDAKLREQEREMERLEEERERQRAEREAKAAAGNGESVSDLLAKKIEDLKLSDKKESSTPSSVADKLANLNINNDSSASASAPKTGGSDKARTKPAALNLVVPSKPVEPPQPSAALQSLKSARWLEKKELYDPKIYPSGFSSPNPALNSAVTKKNKSFKYDAQFLLQFQKVFTEEPSLEFHQQIKSLIGDPDSGRSASTRSAGPGTGRSASKAGPAAGGFPSMGQFGAKPLPLGSGTTSAERFAMSQGQISRPGLSNPMGSFGGRGGFPSSQGMSRTPSAAGGMPNSPRQGSRRGGGSKREDFGGKGGGNAKNMPLTAGQEVKPIAVTASGWKPTSIGNKAAQAPIAQLAQSGHLDPEMVQRKVKAALNKMTPEKFDKISDQILTIAGQSKNEQDGRTLRQVIQLTFEKATDEAHWASMYAKFCKRMLETMSPEIRDESILDKNGNVVSGGALFRKYLLNRCQEEFERGWKVDLPEQPADEDGKKTGEAALLSDEYYIAAAAKRRGLGLVQFIGELFKLGMLTERIMHECVRKLLEFQGIPDEAEIESLTKLLRTIGGNLDSTDKGRGMMDAYFQRINTIMDLEGLPSRLKFMLMDVVDLRRANWASKEANKGPKTLKEIQAEAEAAAAQKAAESARNNSRGGPGGGRPQAGRGDARQFSAYNQALQNQIGSDDLRRLKGSATRTPSNTASFGPTSMFSSRSNSGRRLVPGGGFNRGDDSGASSRTGTPPTAVAHTNAFGLLADAADHPASPPSTKASPALTKASLEGDEKKEA
ncbi:Eukaryotic translation initiation factor 4 gamma [Coniochaeta hoffmannii]|uniref:Eukaryotic translation initiation factor 4 gamma n=1 Tax=Coniochaeta hoffmannii TaxID=91930 RepID=A0AA38R2N4_9PEZI|nr:Eukaryotic translation initiation factor 4 gamma [Coniochaeta hoffmannii]